MKTGQLTLFTDIINEAVKYDLEAKGQVLPDDHWINQPLKSENEKTLLLSAIDQNQYDFLDILLRSGADPNLYSQDLNNLPLIFATQKRDLRAMTILLLFDADVNKVNWKSGESALHAACERRYS